MKRLTIWWTQTTNYTATVSLEDEEAEALRLKLKEGDCDDWLEYIEEQYPDWARECLTETEFQMVLDYEFEEGD